jgi:hypothetical protein
MIARFHLMYNLAVKTGNEGHSLTRSSLSFSRQIANAHTSLGYDTRATFEMGILTA